MFVKLVADFMISVVEVRTAHTSRAEEFVTTGRVQTSIFTGLHVS